MLKSSPTRPQPPPMEPHPFSHAVKSSLPSVQIVGKSQKSAPANKRTKKHTNQPTSKGRGKTIFHPLFHVLAGLPFRLCWAASWASKSSLCWHIFVPLRYIQSFLPHPSKASRPLSSQEQLSRASWCGPSTTDWGVFQCRRKTYLLGKPFKVTFTTFKLGVFSLFMTLLFFI